MDPEALMRMMQMGDQSGGPQGKGSGRPRGGAPNGAPGAVPDIGALLSSLGPDGMPDFDKIARQTGMDPAEMRGHAQRLWKHMDELAEKSPDEYRSFLEKQADNAGVDADKAFGQAGGAGAGGGDPKDIAAAVEKNRTAAATAAAVTARRDGMAEGMSASLLTEVAGLSTARKPVPAAAGKSLIEEVKASHEVKVERGEDGVPVGVEVVCILPSLMSAADANLEVSARYVHLTPGGGEDTMVIALPVPVDPDDVSAKFKKKDRRLVLRLKPSSE